MKTNPEDSAFALPGLTKREYFSVEALNAMIIKSPYKPGYHPPNEDKGYTDDHIDKVQTAMARSAVEYADKLIKELNKEIE